MKKYILSAFLLFACLGNVFASGTPLSELVGDYTCTIPGFDATLELSGSEGNYILDFCRTLGPDTECHTAELFDEVLAGKLQSKDGETAREIEGLLVEVVDSGDKVILRVSTDDGLSLEFTK